MTDSNGCGHQRELMRYLLDSTLFIDLAVGRPGVAELVESLFSEPNDLYTCDVIVAEALTGGTEDERSRIAGLIRVLEYVSTSPDAATWAAESRRRRGATSGRSLGDAIVAGVAWSLDATVVTRNPTDFETQGIPVLAYD
jgi:predicted nucleic acid-binding protein